MPRLASSGRGTRLPRWSNHRCSSCAHSRTAYYVLRTQPPHPVPPENKPNPRVFPIDAHVRKNSRGRSAFRTEGQPGIPPVMAPRPQHAPPLKMLILPSARDIRIPRGSSKVLMCAQDLHCRACALRKPRPRCGSCESSFEIPAEPIGARAARIAVRCVLCTAHSGPNRRSSAALGHSNPSCFSKDAHVRKPRTAYPGFLCGPFQELVEGRASASVGRPFRPYTFSDGPEGPSYVI